MANITDLKVLIVDDHFLTRQVVADTLRELSVLKLTMVADGAAARDALLQAHDAGEPFDAVYLDHNMPFLEGFELLRQFRARPEYNATAFIMLTSVTDQASVIKAVKAGANGYLIKPVTKQAIGKKLTEVAGWIEKQKASASA